MKKDNQPKEKGTLSQAAKASAKKKPKMPKAPEELEEKPDAIAETEEPKHKKKKTKKGSKTKLSALKKAFKKKKTSAKAAEKPSQKKKKAIKSVAKAEAEKEAAKILKEEKKKAEEAKKPEEAMKAEESAEPKKKAKTEGKKAQGAKKAEDPYLNKEVVVLHEAAGATNFAQVGLVTKVFADGKYQVLFDKGQQILAPQHFGLLSERPLLSFMWPKQTNLSRAHLQEMLSSIACMPQRTSEDNNEEHDFIPVTPETVDLEDQSLWLGWQYLRWAFEKAGEPYPEDSHSFSVIDPGLPYMLSRFSEDRPEIREEAMRAQARPFRTVLVPIYASGHWTVLKAEKTEPKQTSGFSWTVFDSLSERSEGQAIQQLRIGQILDESFQLPEARCNWCTQTPLLNQCGFYCLSFIEQCLRLKARRVAQGASR